MTASTVQLAGPGHAPLIRGSQNVWHRIIGCTCGFRCLDLKDPEREWVFHASQHLSGAASADPRPGAWTSPAAAVRDPLTADELAIDAASAMDRVMVYTKDVAGVTQTFVRVSDGSVYELDDFVRAYGELQRLRVSAATPASSRGRYSHLVVIFREQPSEVTGFHDLAAAEAFYDLAGTQWSETFLVEILKGPLV